MNNILIIEDEEKIARFVELELKHEGYAADKATDGRTGLEMAETGYYDLIVLDIMLPQLSGILIQQFAGEGTAVDLKGEQAVDAAFQQVRQDGPHIAVAVGVPQIDAGSGQSG